MMGPSISCCCKCEEMLTEKKGNSGKCLGVYGRLLNDANIKSTPTPFIMKVKVHGKPAYKSFSLPFNARYTDESCYGISTVRSPYLGEIDLTSYFIQHQLAFTDEWAFPGFEVPAKGKLQVTIYNHESTTTLVMCIPYNISDLLSNHERILKASVYKKVIYASIDSESKACKRYLVGKLVFRFVRFNDQYLLFDKVSVLFTSRSKSCRDYLLPLTDPRTSVAVRARGSSTIIETRESDQFPVDMNHYMKRCIFCDIVDRTYAMCE